MHMVVHNSADNTVDNIKADTIPLKSLREHLINNSFTLDGQIVPLAELQKLRADQTIVDKDWYNNLWEGG